MFEKAIRKKTGKSIEEIFNAQLKLKEGDSIFLPWNSFTKYKIKRICSEEINSKKVAMDDRIYYRHDSWMERSEVIPVNLL
jgi:hypothetical protein